MTLRSERSLRLREQFRHESRFEIGSRNGRAGAPAGGRRWRLLLLVLLILVTAMIVDYGSLPPSVHVGEVAPTTVQARVDFRYEDELQQQFRRQQIRTETPSVYRSVPEWREQTFGRIKDVVADATPESMPVATEKARQYGLPSPLPLERLSPERRDLILEALDRISRSWAIRSVLAHDAYEQERSSGRDAIIRRGTRVERRDANFVSTRQAVGLIQAELRDALSELPIDPRKTVLSMVDKAMRPSLTLDVAATEQRREEAAARVPRQVVNVNAGDVIVSRGEVVDEAALRKIWAEQERYEAQLTLAQRLRQKGGLLVIVAVILTAFAAYIRKHEPAMLGSFRQLAAFSLLGLGTLALGKFMALHGLSPYLTPVVLVAMIATVVFGARAATAAAAVLSILVGLELGGNWPVAIVHLAGSIAAIHVVDRAQQRPVVPWAGALSGLVLMIMVVSWDLYTGTQDVWPLMLHGGWGMLNGVGSGILLLGTLSVWESVFQVTTTVKLLELSDQNHPALRDLERRAPGTYQHSLRVGILCEAACEAIGADALLARVGAYYHDLGKMAKPEYYAENAAPGRSRHDGLSPYMSAIIIISHVKDGLELAREYRLPPALKDFIAQHHGTTPVEFFHRKAVARAEEDNHPAPDVSLFCYPGPKPQTREAAVMLLADTVEAAARTLDNPSASRLSHFVRDLSRRKLDDGQFDECPMTLRELRQVEETIIEQLTSMYHQRVRYPGQNVRGEYMNT